MRDSSVRKYELGLFWGLRSMINNEPNGYKVFIQYINNILFFIPFGFLLSELVGKRWKVVPLAGLCMSVIIELTQYITARGLAETDDVISNTIGATIGFLMWIVKKNK